MLGLVSLLAITGMLTSVDASPAVVASGSSQDGRTTSVSLPSSLSSSTNTASDSAIPTASSTTHSGIGNAILQGLGSIGSSSATTVTVHGNQTSPTSISALTSSRTSLDSSPVLGIQPSLHSTLSGTSSVGYAIANSQRSVSSIVHVTPASVATLSTTYQGLMRTSVILTKTYLYPNITSTETGVIVDDCQAASVWWGDLSISIRQETPVTQTVSDSLVLSEIVTYGTADVYTIIDSVPYARGNLTATSTSTWLSTSSSTWLISTMAGPAILTAAPVPMPPSCIIYQADCLSMRSTYSQSLTSQYIASYGNVTGLGNVPDPLPPLSASPRCYDYPCPVWTPTVLTGCTIFGRNVKLFYWPSNTDSLTNIITAAPRTAVSDGLTMTSPSIYLSFDTLYATDSHNRPTGLCGTADEGWPPIGNHVGGEHNGKIISLLPESVSTLEVPWNLTKGGIATTFPDEAMSAMLDPNASKYQYWIDQILRAQVTWITSRINLTHLTQPDPRAYYLRPRYVSELAQGCYLSAPPLYCNTIFVDQYRAQLAVPDQVRNLDPAWASCAPVLDGVFDPPVALTAANTADKPVISTISPSEPITSAYPMPSPVLSNPIASATLPTDPPLLVTASSSKSLESIKPIVNSWDADRGASASPSTMVPVASLQQVELDPQQSREGSKSASPNNNEGSSSVKAVLVLTRSVFLTIVSSEAVSIDHTLASTESGSTHTSSTNPASPSTQSTIRRTTDLEVSIAISWTPSQPVNALQVLTQLIAWPSPSPSMIDVEISAVTRLTDAPQALTRSQDPEATLAIHSLGSPSTAATDVHGSTISAQELQIQPSVSTTQSEAAMSRVSVDSQLDPTHWSTVPLNSHGVDTASSTATAPGSTISVPKAANEQSSTSSQATYNSLRFMESTASTTATSLELPLVRSSGSILAQSKIDTSSASPQSSSPALLSAGSVAGTMLSLIQGSFLSVILLASLIR